MEPIHYYLQYMNQKKIHSIIVASADKVCEYPLKITLQRKLQIEMYLSV